MLRFHKFLLALLLATIANGTHSADASPIPTYDLITLCFLSTDVVEARLTRHHIPGQEEWKDTFTVAVLNSLEGNYQAGNQISRLDLTLYDPAQIGQHCLLFLTRKREDRDWTGENPPPVRLVDMLLVDSRSHVRRYFQWSNPGGLVADSFNLTTHSPTKIKTMRVHGARVSIYQENDTFEEDDTAEQWFRTLADERLLIASRWVAAKKMKTPPYQVLHQTER